MKRFFVLSLFATLFTTAGFASAREGLLWRLFQNPEILLDPVFWGVVGFGVLCIFIYAAVKDKDE